MPADESPEAAFYGWLLDDVLTAIPRLAADPNDGGYYAVIDPARRKHGVERFAVDTARHSYIAALAFAHSGRPEFIATAKAAWASLVALYWDDPAGGFRSSTTSTGAKTAYDQGFAFLAAAQLSAVDTAFAASGWIDRVWSYIGSRFRAPGTKAFLDREPGGAEDRRCHNTQLHFLEPLLVLAQQQPQGLWLREAADIIEAVRTHYLDGERRSLRQYLGHDLRPLAGDAGLARNAGHHFEWAWMVRRYITLSGDESARDLEHLLVAFARRHGVSAALAPLYAYEVRPDGSVIDPSARLWSQTEAIKVAAQDGPEGNILQHGRELLAALLQYFRMHGETQFWYEAISADGAPIDRSARVGMLFHLYVAAYELMRCGERHAAS